MLWYVIIVLYIFMSCWTIVIALTSWCYFDFVLIYTNSILHISMCVCLILLLLTDVSICYHMVFHWISRMSDRNNLIGIAVLWLSKYCRVRCQSWIEERSERISVGHFVPWKLCHISVVLKRSQSFSVKHMHEEEHLNA